MMMSLGIFSLFISSLSAQISPMDSSITGDEPVTVEADDSIVCNEQQGQCIATGNAVAIRGKFRVNADTLTLHFQKNGSRHDIKELSAHGNVIMSTPTEKAYGDQAHYDLSLDRVKLTGQNLKMETPKQTLTARDSLEYWRTKQEGHAYGEAVAVFPEKQQLLKADTLVAYFRDTVGNKESSGHKKQELDHIDALGNVFVSSPEDIITADNGTYYADGEVAELKEKVTLTKGDNQIHGAYATFNMKTNVAQLYGGLPGAQKGQRIHGLIIPKDAKKSQSSSLVKK